MVGSRGTETPLSQGFQESLTYQKSQARAPPTSCHPKVPDRQPHGPVVPRPPAVLAKGLVLRARLGSRVAAVTVASVGKFTQGWVGCLADFDLIPLLKAPWSLCHRIGWGWIGGRREVGSWGGAVTFGQL